MSVILCVLLNFFKRQPSITKAASYGVVFTLNFLHMVFFQYNCPV